MHRGLRARKGLPGPHGRQDDVGLAPWGSSPWATKLHFSEPQFLLLSFGSDARDIVTPSTQGGCEEGMR